MKVVGCYFDEEYGCFRYAHERGTPMKTPDNPLFHTTYQYQAGVTGPVLVPEKSIQDLVIQDMEARKEIGIKNYGTLLNINNGRDMMLDLYEELLDACCYLKGVMLERDQDAS